jgi:hypothetical protein
MSFTSRRKPEITQEVFRSSKTSRRALVLTQPSVPWVLRAKLQSRECDHSPVSDAEDRNAWRRTGTPL